ncbi:hypothetical protein VNO77_20442 [Canavalia gladiata]|uniref:Uncharacterized protein n=1 Tax=Canavalia gladiata TaxID=3824 RepID=A0AAN9LP86_CANGL
MKSSTIAITLFALFLLSSFMSHLSSATADFVVDTDGEAMQNGGTYYILPVFRGKGGGIERVTTGNESCPLTVVQSRVEIEIGLPIRIASPLRIANIYEGLILNLTFTNGPSCSPTPSKWTIVKGLPEGLAIKLPGYNNILSGWFKIEKASLNYKLVFCIRASDTCRDVGISIDDVGIRRLVLVTNNDPLIVRFKKGA